MILKAQLCRVHSFKVSILMTSRENDLLPVEVFLPVPPVDMVTAVWIAVVLQ